MSHPFVQLFLGQPRQRRHSICIRGDLQRRHDDRREQGAVVNGDVLLQRAFFFVFIPYLDTRTLVSSIVSDWRDADRDVC